MCTRGSSQSHVLFQVTNVTEAKLYDDCDGMGVICLPKNTVTNGSMGHVMRRVLGR